MCDEFLTRRHKAQAIADDAGLPLAEIEGRLPPEDIDAEYEALQERREQADEDRRAADRAAAYAEGAGG